MRSELSVLRPDVSCCLATVSAWGREERGLHNSISLTQTHQVLMLSREWEVVNVLRKRKGKDKQTQEDELNCHC